MRSGSAQLLLHLDRMHAHKTQIKIKNSSLIMRFPYVYAYVDLEISARDILCTQQEKKKPTPQSQDDTGSSVTLIAVYFMYRVMSISC